MENSKIEKKIQIFTISGGKGIAGHTMIHSLIIQYPDCNFQVNVIPNIQSEEKIIEVVQNVKEAGGVLTHTMVNTTLRRRLIEECKKQEVREIDFMGPLADYLEVELGLQSINVPGLYRRINAKYFDRIEAIEYTLNHDDGLNSERLKKAEIILTGVSRSGKTPLSVYMSMYGWKVANIPLVNGIDPPQQLFEVDPRRVFGLSINPGHLIPLREKRLEQMNNRENINYVDTISIRDELRYANYIFEKGGFTVINVNDKPIETTANEIIGMISDRFEMEEKNINESNETLD
jgi:regulator of PEP synthase PpsR (kinase-PPPase family)